MSQIRLEEQHYFVKIGQSVEKINHTNFLKNNKQIIRLQTDIFRKVETILHGNNKISLYNHYNPINIDLIRQFESNQIQNNGALVANIIGRKGNHPILDGNTMIQVEVQKMYNIFLENIQDEDLEKSIIFFGKAGTVYDLLQWLSTKFYRNNLTVEELIKSQRLFFRQIILSDK